MPNRPVVKRDDRPERVRACKACEAPVDGMKGQYVRRMQARQTIG
jgi:hypothetical protein